mmetsp:Transcript_42736/g.101730  ORF Transcript_42736/g.101730 Transcript_42736/m.101730 type:complete len:318 (+) Transcript_42736:166-1119(+)
MQLGAGTQRVWRPILGFSSGHLVGEEGVGRVLPPADLREVRDHSLIPPGVALQVGVALHEHLLRLRLHVRGPGRELRAEERVLHPLPPLRPQPCVCREEEGAEARERLGGRCVRESEDQGLEEREAVLLDPGLCVVLPQRALEVHNPLQEDAHGPERLLLGEAEARGCKLHGRRESRVRDQTLRAEEDVPVDHVKVGRNQLRDVSRSLVPRFFEHDLAHLPQNARKAVRGATDPPEGLDGHADALEALVGLGHAEEGDHRRDHWRDQILPFLAALLNRLDEQVAHSLHHLNVPPKLPRRFLDHRPHGHNHRHDRVLR